MAVRATTMRYLAIPLALIVLVLNTGCLAPMMVVAGDPATARAECMKHGCFAATRMDTSAIGATWHDADLLLPGKVMCTAVFLVDIPFSVAFDALLDTPLKLLRGRPGCPWREVEQVSWKGGTIRVGMTEEEVRRELARADGPVPEVRIKGVWRVTPGGTRPVELYFRRERVHSILEHTGIRSAGSLAPSPRARATH